MGWCYIGCYIECYYDAKLRLGSKLVFLYDHKIVRLCDTNIVLVDHIFKYRYRVHRTFRINWSCVLRCARSKRTPETPNFTGIKWKLGQPEISAPPLLSFEKISVQSPYFGVGTFLCTPPPPLKTQFQGVPISGGGSGYFLYQSHSNIILFLYIYFKHIPYGSSSWRLIKTILQHHTSIVCIFQQNCSWI